MTKISISKVVATDWPALAACVGIPIIWAVHFIFPLIRQIKVPLPILLPVCISVTLFVCLAWRFARIAQLFSHGQLTVGQITGLSIVKDRGRLEFVFEYQGKVVSAWMPIHKNKAVLSLTCGANVEVLFDACTPTKAIIKHLYAA
ncbi:hypothetical protein [Thauera sp. SDU_THAU2]|uniref:hypothetical protein n=1 Tax=Thauera sp. SDU_THAU2 TaxID=3136633 RepID=UPI00311F4309